MSVALVNCPACGRAVELVWVRSHYQCPLCRTVIESCCDGTPTTTIEYRIGGGWRQR